MIDQPAKFCRTCGAQLDLPDPATRDCGGDCVGCMAEAGDPDCVKQMQELAKKAEKPWDDLTADDLDGWTTAELREEAKHLGVPYHEDMNREQLIDALVEVNE